MLQTNDSRGSRLDTVQLNPQTCLGDCIRHTLSRVEGRYHTSGSKRPEIVWFVWSSLTACFGGGGVPNRYFHRKAELSTKI